MSSNNYYAAANALLSVFENKGGQYEIIRYMLIDCYIEEQKFHKAIEYIEKLLKETPEEKHEKLYCYIGYCYEKLHDLDSAIFYYEKVIELNSSLAIVCEM